MEFELCAARMSEYKDGFLHVAIDAHGTKDQPGTGRSLETIFPLGIVARPMDPDVDSDTEMVLGAGCLLAEQGGQAWALPTTDPRHVAAVPELQKGGTALYNATGMWLRLDGDNVFQVYVKQSANSAHAITIDPETSTISIAHAAGQHFSLNEDGGILMCSANGQNWIKVSNDGIVMSGKVKVTGNMVVGDPVTAQGVGLTGAPGPVSTILKASPV